MKGHDYHQHRQHHSTHLGKDFLPSMHLSVSGSSTKRVNYDTHVMVVRFDCCFQENTIISVAFSFNNYHTLNWLLFSNVSLFKPESI